VSVCLYYCHVHVLLSRDSVQDMQLCHSYIPRVLSPVPSPMIHSINKKDAVDHVMGVRG